MRSDAQVLAAATVAVQLGGRVYELAPMKKYRNRMFCSRFAELIGDANMFAAMVDQYMRSGGVAIVGMDLVEILPRIQNVIGHNIHDLVDLIYVADASLAEDRDFIEEFSSMDECFAALAKCFELAFGPFGRILEIVQMAKPKTKTNAPSTSESSTDGTESQ